MKIRVKIPLGESGATEFELRQIVEITIRHAGSESKFTSQYFDFIDDSPTSVSQDSVKAAMTSLSELIGQPIARIELK